jgi:hypothetical protein
MRVHHVHKSLSVDPILSHINPVHSFTAPSYIISFICSYHNMLKCYMYCSSWRSYASAGALIECLLHCPLGLLLTDSTPSPRTVHGQAVFEQTYFECVHRTLITPYFGFTTQDICIGGAVPSLIFS